MFILTSIIEESIVTEMFFYFRCSTNLHVSRVRNPEKHVFVCLSVFMSSLYHQIIYEVMHEIEPNFIYMFFELLIPGWKGGYSIYRGRRDSEFYALFRLYHWKVHEFTDRILPIYVWLWTLSRVWKWGCSPTRYALW